MRKLNLSDVFRFARMMSATKAIPVITELLDMASAKATEHGKSKNDDWMIDLGIQGTLRILNCAAEQGAESAVYRFLAPVWETDEKAIADMTLETVVANVSQMVRENDMPGFFDSARKIVGM